MALLHHILLALAPMASIAGAAMTLPVRAAPPINTPAPMLSPAIPNCEQFRLVYPGETCDSLAGSLGLTVPALANLNPAFGHDGAYCPGGLVAGQWACVKSHSGGGSGGGGGGGGAPSPKPKQNKPGEILPDQIPIIKDEFLSRIREHPPVRTAKPHRPKKIVTVTKTRPPTKPTATQTIPDWVRTGGPMPGSNESWDEISDKCKWLGQGCDDD